MFFKILCGPPWLSCFQDSVMCSVWYSGYSAKPNVEGMLSEWGKLNITLAPRRTCSRPQNHAAWLHLEIGRLKILAATSQCLYEPPYMNHPTETWIEIFSFVLHIVCLFVYQLHCVTETKKIYSCCHCGNQDQLPGEEGLDGWPLCSQDTFMGWIEL
jgi:hypothetical protein